MANNNTSNTTGEHVKLVLTVLSTEDCIALDSMSREYEEGYDDDSVGLFTVTINFTSFGA